MLQPPVGFDSGVLEILIEALYRRHDALRLRFEPGTQGWQAEHVALDEAMVRASCVCEELPRAEERRAFLSERCTHWQGSFDLQHGPLLRAVYFAAPQAQDSRVLLIVHHIVVDGVSWRVLLTDLERAYRQHARGERIDLGAKSSSYQQWGEALQEYACSESLRAQKGYWLEQSAPSRPLPVDRGSAGWGTIGTTRTVAVSLSASETRALQQQCSRAYRTQINELLLAGVYLGMRQWTGESGLRLRLEGHGREELFERLDLTQTVGWFTSIYPLKLDSASAEVGEVIKAVKEQYRSIPQHGVGYGILRYLSRDAELIAAADNNEPQLEFNYLGQFDQVLNEDTAFQAAPEEVGQKISPQRARMHQLGLSSKVFGGQLHFVLGYSSEQYEDATMQALAGYLGAGLRRVIEHCQHRDSVSYTPSDFPLARVDQQQLEDWQARYPTLVRLYPATPMQAGLLFESLLEPSTYVVQTSMRLKGGLDGVAFRRAWQQVIERHDILRTAFVGAGEQLQQLVCAQAVVPWHEQDWRGLSDAEQAQRFEQYRSQDRQAGFDFTQPPLLRLAVFRLGEERYQLLWTLHHILLDGWCLPLVYRDVITLYQAQLEGRAGVLSAAPVYEQYIGWLQRQDRSAARAHWRELLGEMQAPTPLVVDRLPTGGSGHREQYVELSVEQTEALQSVAQAHHTTVNTLLQWAWGYLLHRYSGEAEVVFGATVSGRPAEVAGIEEMLGLFINTLPVKLDFTGPLEMTRSLRTLHESFQRSTQHGYLSLSEIQRQSRVPAGTALFDSLLVFENYPVASRLEAAAMLSRLEIEHAHSRQSTHYKLTLIGNLGAQLQVKLCYRAEHFTEAAIDRLEQHLRRILVQLPQIVASNRPVDLLTEEEARQLDCWSLIQRPYERDLCIHQWFEAHADSAPQQIALVMDDQQLTYRQLNERANRVAHYLIEQGARPGHCVGLCVERSFEMIVGILGILKTGAAYVPLDPRYPKARLAYLLEDSGTDWVLTQSWLKQQASLEDVRTFSLDDCDALQAYSTANIAHAAPLSAEQLAVVLYTSGSTGKPKGAQLAHRTIVNLISSLMARYEAMAAPVPTLQFASMSFDWSLAEIGSAFFTGGSLVLISEEDRLDLGNLAAVLKRHHVGRTFLTTAMVSQFAQTVIERQIELPALKMLQAGGEQLAITPAIRHWAARSGCTLLNVYGPTESGVVVSVHALNGDSAQWPALPPIGKPVDNVRLHILDASRQRVPIGVIGELYVAGDGLARGYLNRPELNASKFIEACIDGAGPERLYRTGDLARWLPEGSIEYVSRVDTQIKLRGFRVEPGEIETLLAEHPQISEAVVVALGEGSDKQLVGYIVSRDVSDEMALHADLQQRLAAQLPSYMVPTIFVSLEQMPLSANRKVDRGALPLPDLRPEIEVQPGTETEVRLAAIWRRILKLDRVSVKARFFALGGHSLLATQMVSAVLAEFGCVLKIKDLFTHQTIAELAALIDVLSASSIASDTQALSHDNEALEEMEW
jgi:amino acid adenylation domain-containing protein/non-ribosomal peptide synthase protein (TIGR01720 family)